MPENCPVCGNPIRRIDTEAAFRCINPACGGVVREKLIHFASRDAMDIEGLGPAVVDSLCISAGCGCGGFLCVKRR